MTQLQKDSKTNIARIAKAALHKLPGESSLNVNFVCPVFPLFPVCPVHDHHDHGDYEGDLEGFPANSNELRWNINQKWTT